MREKIKIGFCPDSLEEIDLEILCFSLPIEQSLISHAERFAHDNYEICESSDESFEVYIKFRGELHCFNMITEWDPSYSVSKCEKVEGA